MISIEKFQKGVFTSSIIIGLLLMVLSFVGIFFSILDPKGFILYFYTFIFGVLIICGEFKKFKQYFGFLHYYLGKGLFQIFVGLSILIFDWNSNIFAKIVSVFTILVGLCQIGIMCIPKPVEPNGEELPDELPEELDCVAGDEVEINIPEPEMR